MKSQVDTSFHYVALDGLRGFAALYVFLSHVFPSDVLSGLRAK